MLQILVRLLSSSLVILFIITGSHLPAVVSRKGVNNLAELLQNNVARNKVELVNVHAAVGRESNLISTQKSLRTTMEKVESKEVVADAQGERKVKRRSLFSKEKKNESGFVAYSADYGKPRHHPPKNN